MNFTQTISKTLRDILSPPVLALIVKIGLGSIFLWVVILSALWTPFSHWVASYITMIPLIGSWGWLQGTGAFLAALALGYGLIIITISIATSLLSEKVLKRLAQKHYNVQPVGTPALHRSLYYTLKASAIFLLLLLAMLPLIFVPIAGQIIMLWLWSILLKDPTVYDVGSLFVSNETALKPYTRKTRLIAIIAALFNYVPVLNIFAPLFAQILFMHTIMAKESRNA